MTEEATPSRHHEELLDMLRKRDVLRAELEAHLAACVAREPHGYLSCQLTRERIEERLGRVEARIRALASGEILRAAPAVRG